MTNHDDYLAEYQRKFDALPFWERVRIKISLFINGVIYWRVANILWWLFRYDLFDGRFVNNLEPDPQCDDEFEYNTSTEWHAVACEECGAQGPRQLNAEDAVKAWNCGESQF